MELVEAGTEELLYSFFFVYKADKKRYRDLQKVLTNTYTQNRNNYPHSATDAKRMINNYVPKFVNNTNTNTNEKKDKGSQQQGNKDKQHLEEEEFLFLQQQDNNWQYCGWCKKKHLAKFDECACVKDSGNAQTVTNTTTNETEQGDESSNPNDQAR